MLEVWMVMYYISRELFFFDLTNQCFGGNVWLHVPTNDEVPHTKSQKMTHILVSIQKIISN